MTLSFLRDELAALERAGLYRSPRTVEGPIAPRTVLEGRSVILFASNSYLGLSHHPDVVAASAAAAQRYGTGSGASRLISGTTALHRELEQAIARLKGTEDAVLFGSGYQANVGAIPALVGPEDLVLSDELNHASLIDGIRQSRANVKTYPHGNVDRLAELLETERFQHRRCLVVTDGVFSMDGDVAPLRALARLAHDHEALFMVDDAHGTGVLGARGAGSVESTGVEGDVAVQMGTLSKALASEGGFVAGSKDLCEFMRNRCRAFIYSTAPAPPSVAAALAALRIVEEEPERRLRLSQNADRLRAALADCGLDTPARPTPILPIVVGRSDVALRFAAALESNGVFAPAIRPPTVPQGTSRIRVSVMATHTEEDIDEAASAFAKAADATGVFASVRASS